MSSPYRGQPYAANNASSPYLYPPQASATFSTNNFEPASSNTHLVAPGKSPLASSRSLARTPSPTPSEAAELAREGALDWKRLRDWRFWIRREWLWYYVLTAVIVAVVALVTIFHTQIVNALKPAATFLKDLPAGWLIPVGILFVISFPPLFGHEIVAVLCGIVWGLGIGFAIVCAGTFIGEVGNFYAFRWCCRARGEKLEKTNITYGVLARVVREGGFKIALVARLSAIPGHFTTAVFSSCGMGIVVFSLAALLSLPKQFVTVYLGVLIDTSDQETIGQRLASYAVVGITVAITALAMWYIYREMNRVKPAYIYDRRKARGAKLAGDASPYPGSTNSPYVAEPGMSAVNVSLHAPDSGSYSPHGDPGAQQWDASGRAVGNATNPAFIRQPAPQHGRVPTFRTEGGGGYDAAGRRYEDGEDGAVYPVSPRADGRVPVRQASDSDESYETAHASSRQPSDARSQQSSYPPSYHTQQPQSNLNPWTPVSVAGPFPRVDFGPPPPGTPTHPYGRAPPTQQQQQYQMREMQPAQGSPYVSPQHTGPPPQPVVPRSTSPPPINTNTSYPSQAQPTTYAGAHPISPAAYAPSSPALPYPGSAGSQPGTPTQGAPGFAQQQFAQGSQPGTPTQYSQFAGQQQQHGYGHDPYGVGQQGQGGQDPYGGYGYAR